MAADGVLCSTCAPPVLVSADDLEIKSTQPFYFTLINRSMIFRLNEKRTGASACIHLSPGEVYVIISFEKWRGAVSIPQHEAALCSAQSGIMLLWTRQALSRQVELCTATSDVLIHVPVKPSTSPSDSSFSPCSHQVFQHISTVTSIHRKRRPCSTFLFLDFTASSLASSLPGLPAHWACGPSRHRLMQSVCVWH